MQSKTGTITSPSTTGVDSYNIGFKPDFVCFYYAGKSSNISVGIMEGFGVACNRETIRQVSTSVWGEKKKYATHQTETKVISQIENKTKKLESKLSSFDTLGFSLDWLSTQPGSTIYYWAVEGSMNCNVKTIQSPTTSGQVTYSLGFTPKCLISFGVGAGDIVQYVQGFGTSDNQFTSGYSYPDPVCAQRFDRLFENRREGVIDTSVKLESLDIGGFTLDWADVSSQSHKVYILALDGAYFEVSKDRLPNQTGNAISVSPIQPTTAFIKGTFSNSSFMSTISSSSEQKMVSTFLTDKFMYNGRGDGIVQKLECGKGVVNGSSGSLSEFVKTGYKINLDITDLTSKEYACLAISGSAPISYSRLASRPDFEKGELYDNYRRYPFYATRAQTIQERCSGKILIAGCGWGYLVDECLALGLDAWGCDASSYAIFKSQEVLSSSSASRVLFGNVLSASDLNSIKTSAGVSEKFDWCITDDMLTVAEDDSEVNSILSMLRNHSINLLHIVTPQMLETNQVSGLLWKTPEDWKSLVGTDTLITVSGEVF